MELKEFATVDMIDAIVLRELHMDISDRSAKSLMENLFVSYI